MDVKRNAEIPMSAMWTPGSLAGGEDEEVRSEADIREAASVTNIFGKPFVAAESMTSVGKAFQEYPEKLKRTADLEMASGLNRFVIHTSVHQPLDIGPGFSLGPFGQYFSRLETWSGAGAKAWISYLGRSSYMLQQGKNVADILYYYGENTNITWVCREHLPKLPSGIEFDFVNASILKNDIKAQNGVLMAPSGNEYKVLLLDESAKEMTLSTLQKIKSLQDAGVKVAGQKPENSPSLADNPVEFKNLAAQVVSKMVELQSLNLTPDVIVSGTEHQILYKHRQTEEEKDIYWINNRSEKPTQAVISFNISGKTPILWNPETGCQEALSFEIVEGRTIIPLALKSWDALFIVFEKATVSNSFLAKNPVKKSEETLSNIWTVTFNGTPKTYSDLESWTKDPSTQYFSGTANYTTSFKQKKIKKGGRYILEISDVHNIAEVILNDETVGTIWKKPYQLDLTKTLKKGSNKLEIKVTNTWANRLIGDAQADAKDKSTFTSMPLVAPQMPLMPAGIIGKVKVVRLE